MPARIDAPRRGRRWAWQWSPKRLLPQGVHRLVVVDPHTPTLEAQCRIPVETLSAVAALSGELAGDLPHGAAVVAPDWARSN